jgi:hypothetical protein
MMHSKWPSKPRCNDVALNSGRWIRSLFSHNFSVAASITLLDRGRWRTTARRRTCATHFQRDERPAAIQYFTPLLDRQGDVIEHKRGLGHRIFGADELQRDRLADVGAEINMVLLIARRRIQIRELSHRAQ